MFGQLLLILLNISLIIGNPIGGLGFDLEELDDSNYDVVIDQKQNGTQNFRIRVNGLSVAIPAEEAEENHSPSQEMDIAALLGFQSSSTNPQLTSVVTNGQNSFAEIASLFDWKKSNTYKKSTDTQGRTKDLPTDGQLAGDTKHALKDYTKNAGKKYKLLIGEKYIVPLIQFLKRNAEHLDEE